MSGVRPTYNNNNKRKRSLEEEKTRSKKMAVDGTVCDAAGGFSAQDTPRASSEEPASIATPDEGQPGSARSDCCRASEGFPATVGAEQPAAISTKQQTGASAAHVASSTPTTTTTNNPDNGAHSRQQARKLCEKNARASLSSHPKHLLLQSQSQTRINHSLESINSRYSNSSANDDSVSMQQQQQHNQQPGSNVSPMQPRRSLRPRLSTSLAGSCSPIEAQLASSTCDLGINLLDGISWRGSFSAAPGAPATPTAGAEPAKPLVAFISLADKAPHEDSQLQDGGGGGAKPPAELCVEEVEAPKPPFMFAGVLASIVGSVFFSLSVLCIKLLPYQEGFTEKVKALCFRGVFVTFLCGVAILVQRGTFIVRRDELLVNILRAVLGTCGVLGLYCSLSYISMGDATALIFSSPIWTSILSHFILHEPLQWLQLVALPASLFGIVLIAHPGLIFDVEHLHPAAASATAVANDSVSALVASVIAQNGSASSGSSSINQTAFDLVPTSAQAPLQPPSSFEFEHRWPGIVIALSTSLLVSCVYIALKFRKTTPIQTTTFWFGVFMILASLALQCFVGPIDIPLTLYEWALLFGNGVTSWLGQSFLQWAFLYEEAGVLSIVRTLDVAMTFVLSALFLEEEILWTSIVGATIIGLVVVSIMLNEWLKKLSCTQRKNSIDKDVLQISGIKHDKQRASLSFVDKGSKSQQSEHHQSKKSAYIVASSKA